MSTRHAPSIACACVDCVRHFQQRAQRHSIVGPGAQVLGQRNDHAYAKGCDCSTCTAVRAKAEQVRDHAVDALMKPMAPVGSLLGTRTGRVYRMAIEGNQAYLGTLERATPKVRGKAARKAEKRERRAARVSQAHLRPVEERHAELQ